MIEEHLISLCRLWSQNSNLTVNISEQKGVYYTAYRRKGGENKKSQIYGDSGYTQYDKDAKFEEIDHITISCDWIGTTRYNEEGEEYVEELDDEFGFAMYRNSRFGTWHEAMHYLHTPVSLVNRVAELKIVPEAFNILEDYRITEKGLKKYRGYRMEKDFAYRLRIEDYADKQKERLLRPYASEEEGVKWGFRDLIQYIFANLFLDEPDLISYPNVVMDKHRHRIDTLLTDCKRMLHPDHPFPHKNVVDLSENLSRIMDDIAKEHGFSNASRSNGVPQSGTEGDPSPLKRPAHGLNPNNVSRMNDKMRPSKYIKKEFEQLKAEAKMAKEFGENELDTTDSETMTLTKEGNMTITNPGNKPDRYATFKAKARTISKKLRQEIMRLKREYSESCSDIGDDIDTDLYLEHDPMFYVTEEKKKPLNDILLIVDLSSSTSSMHEDYLMATLSCCEAMNELGINFGIYGFKHASRERELCLVKTKNSQYDSRAKARLGALVSSGGTPLGSTVFSIKSIAPYYKVAIILTDGESTEEWDYTRQGFLDLYKTGLEVHSMGFGKTKWEVDQIKKYLTSLMHPQQKRNVKSISNIRKFPAVVLDLLDRGD